MRGAVSVRRISRADCAPFILGIHYAKRWPSVSFIFGLFRDDHLAGVVTYGTPSSAPLRGGIAGPDFTVLELNRLCFATSRPNEASQLVGASLRMLPRNRIIVSFADTAQGHVGYVYQACNFLYTGLSAKRTDWKIAGQEHLHGQTVADEFRGRADRALAMREKYGDDFYLLPRPRKHRYLYLSGDRKWRSDAKVALRYPILPYPKAP